MAHNASAQWQIEHQCPQCGAPATLGEAQRLLLCPYCRTKLYLTAGGHFRYLIPAPDSPHDLIYFPYWRMRGLSFFVTATGVKHRFFDTNLLAAEIKNMPFSLGLRPQVFKLKFASPEVRGRFLHPGLDSRIVMEKGIPDAGPVFHRAFIGEMVSLIYAPAYLQNGALFDALLQKPLCPLKGEEKDLLSALEGAPDWRPRFLATLCPSCGWDLQGDSDALVLICRNCDSAWSFGDNAPLEVPFSIASGDSSATHYLPFWRMKAGFEGIRLASYADLIRVGNLPKALREEFEETPVYFWSPAFKIHPSLFLRLARQMTLYQPEGAGDNKFPAAALFPVTLPPGEARESIVVSLASLVADKRRFIPLLPEIRVTLEEATISYQPFSMKGSELVHTTLQMAIDKNAVAFGIRL